MQSTIDRLRQRREELDDQGGFTLIELLIVIVILGILAAIVVFAVQNLTGSSAQASCKADYKTVETSVEAFNAQMNHYPGEGTTPADVNTAVGTPPAPPTGDVVNTLLNKQGSNGPWLRDFPANGSHYQIVVTKNATTGQPSVISVWNTGTTPTQLGAGTPTLATASVADCGSVS